MGREAEGSGSTHHGLVEHFFRHEYGRAVATLVRSFGTRNLDLIEDGVQSAMTAALTAWGIRGLPDRPGAWLQRAARNHVIDALRRRGVAQREDPPSPTSEAYDAGEPTFDHEVEDDLLRMLFMCCDESLPTDSQLALALKTLCGFSVAEIAFRLLSTPVNIHKRLTRARTHLTGGMPELDTPPPTTLRARLPAVHHIIYLLFNEGYSSAQPDRLIRSELCDEALRLGSLLVQHPIGDGPESWALLALMHFQRARLEARVDGMGGLLLLEAQDRNLWDRAEIELGLRCLYRSAQGQQFSRYHAEAAIAAEHCLASTFEQTRWQEIIDLYCMLERVAPSPLHTLNRAIAVAQLHGPRAGLAVLEPIQPPRWLSGYYLWDATLGELHRRAGNIDRAKRHLTQALQGAPTEAEQRLIQRRRAQCDGGSG